MADNDTEPEAFAALIEEREQVAVPALSVAVDFNDLLDSAGEQEAFRLLGALKDLLQ